MEVRKLENLEPRRGCGYRKLGKLYLVGEGIPIGCHRLPLLLETCPVCGEGIKFSRGFRWIEPLKLFGKCDGKEISQCGHETCPICNPPEEAQGLMWVGEKFYTPRSFTEEALSLGVSKAIGAIPKGFKVGETWVYLAHKKGGEKKIPDPNTLTGYRYEPWPAVFYAFKPMRIEMLIKESEATEEKLRELTDRGITPVIVPDNYEEMVKKAEEAYKKKRKRKRGR